MNLSVMSLSVKSTMSHGGSPKVKRKNLCRSGRVRKRNSPDTSNPKKDTNPSVLSRKFNSMEVPKEETSALALAVLKTLVQLVRNLTSPRSSTMREAVRKKRKDENNFL